MLVLTKSKIGPKNRISITRMELSGTLLAKRLRVLCLLMLTRKLEKVYHLVDSSMVLGYIHKEDAKLKPWEGVRVMEIQMAGEFSDGRL